MNTGSRVPATVVSSGPTLPPRVPTRWHLPQPALESTSKKSFSPFSLSPAT